MRQQGARSRDQQSNKRTSWRVVNVRQTMLDKYRRTAGCPGCAGIGQHTEECRARIEQAMVDKGGARIKLETDASIEKRKFGEQDINPGGASCLTADTHRRRESEQGFSAEMRVYWRSVLLRSTSSCVTRHLSTSAEVALH